MPADTPEDEDILLAAIRSEIYEMHTFMPATILTYNHATQKATVQPVIRGRRFDPETETVSHYKMAPIPNVPVKFQQSTGFSITFPFSVGDLVLLAFCERSLDELLLTGAMDNVNQDLRRFDISDAIILGAIRPFVNPQTQVDPTAMVIAGTQIKLGSNAAAQGLMTQALQPILTAFATTCSTATTAAQIATASATMLASLSSPLYTVKVKAE